MKPSTIAFDRVKNIPDDVIQAKLENMRGGTSGKATGSKAYRERIKAIVAMLPDESIAEVYDNIMLPIRKAEIKKYSTFRAPHDGRRGRSGRKAVKA